MNESILAVPKIDLLLKKVKINLEAPQQVWIHEPFTASYLIQNGTREIQEFSLYVESSESFVFGGLKSSTIKILPLSVHKLEYKVIPVSCGHCVLPKLRLTPLDSLVQTPASNETLSNLTEKPPITTLNSTPQPIEINGLDISQITVFVNTLPQQI